MKIVAIGLRVASRWPVRNGVTRTVTAAPATAMTAHRGPVSPFPKEAEPVITTDIGRIQTKHIQEAQDVDDGLRLLIVRWKNPGTPRSAYDWWDARLAPPARLLSEAFQRDVSLEDTWEWYVPRFLGEMQAAGPTIAIDELLGLLKTGRNVTLLCYCKNDKRCHRSILREIVVARLPEAAARS